MCSLTSTPILLLLHSLTVRVACYRRVFDPFKIQLRISQSAGAGSVTSPATSPAKTNAKPAGKAQMSQGQEIRLLVPQIGVVMDSREFEVLTDVISNVGLAQVRKRKRKERKGKEKKRKEKKLGSTVELLGSISAWFLTSNTICALFSCNLRWPVSTVILLCSYAGTESHHASVSHSAQAAQFDSAQFAAGHTSAGVCLQLCCMTGSMTLCCSCSA